MKTRVPPYLLYLPFTTPGPFVEEDANCVSHVFWDGSNIVDTKGNSWVMSGTVPQITDTPYFPEGFGGVQRGGAGPFSAANYYTLGSGSDVLDFTGDWFGVVVCSPYDISNRYAICNGTPNVDGWGLKGSGSSLYLEQSESGSTHLLFIGTWGAAIWGTMVVCFGRAGGNNVGKMNHQIFQSAAGKTITPATGTPARIGVSSAGASQFPGYLYELYFSTSTPTEEMFTRIIHRFLQQIDTMGNFVTVTRSTRATFEA